MKVAVYFNLHKRLFSIKALEGPDKGHVIAHRDVVKLNDVTFKVSEAGRQRVLREKRKNVHAFTVGNLVPDHGFNGNWEHIRYNPYAAGTFTDLRGAPIHTAEAATLHVQAGKGAINIIR